jgi:hypothetical protein
MTAEGTYVYCLVSAPRKPAIARGLGGLAGTGRIRLIEVADEGTGPDRGRRSSRLKKWLVVSNAPLDRYGEDAINQRLSDLDWVARAAVAHEAVVESFIGASALLPMKLFTIFGSDERAIENIQRQRSRIDAALERVANQIEWGVRVVLHRSKTSGSSSRGARKAGSARAVSGAGYLAGKKAQRDAAAELATRARDVVADLYDDLQAHATDATRRLAGELPVKGDPLLLDAAFLVPRTRSARFRATVARHARTLGSHGYAVTLSGPWPAYSFMKE